MSEEAQNPAAKAITEAVSFAYDRVAVSTASVLAAAKERGHEFADWNGYQKGAPFTLMDELAERHIHRSKVAVSGLGAVAGLGGFLAVVPDAMQFIGLTLRMVTGIAASYGFDPHPDALGGKTKTIILQAYLNAALGESAYKSAESVGLSTAAKIVRTAAERSWWLHRIIIAIGKILGIRLSEKGILRTIPVVSSGVNAGANWFFARQIARAAKKELKRFRDDLRLGVHRDDRDFDGLGN
jgi:hypothetical protein